MDLIRGVNSSQVLSYINTIEMKTTVTPDFIVTISWSLLALILSICGYWLFIVPWSFAKDFTEVSFNFALSRQDSRNPTKKRDVINKLRRTRHMGDALPCPYPNGWYAILESTTLAKGKSTNVSCLGEQFVVYRTEKNEVFVLDAYCPHMGANLGVGGKVVGDSIVCPFHEWSFRGSDGKCNNIPYSSCAIPQSARVRKWKSLDANGYIFIWYHAEDETPWQLPIVKEIEDRKLVYHGRNEYFVSSHIQDMPENGADLAHFTAIHNASFMAGGDPNNTFLRSLGKHHWEATWKANEASDEKHIATVSITHALEFFHKMRFGTMDVKAIQMGPAYVQLNLYTVFGLIVILQATCPVEPLMQKVIHRFYGPPGTGPFMKFVIYGESIMFERDVNIWNHKKFATNPCLAREDRSIKLFRQWYSQFYSENSKSYQQAKESLEW